MAPETRYTSNGEVKIAYESFGDLATGEPLLLIMGLDFQMVWWPDAFCEQLVDAGFAVVRFDNRDTGLSTQFTSLKTENPFRALLGGTKPAYTGDDMLDDVEAVLDAVGWKSAHLMGVSLGASIAQAMALLRPSRVRSLISCMGAPVTAGRLRLLGYVQFGFFRKVARLTNPTTREEAIDHLVEVYRAISSPAHSFPEEWAREVAAISHDRCPRDPQTTQRQVAASYRQRLPPLSTVAVPTLVISGEDDPLIKIAGGRDTAKQVPGAIFRSYPGMGHNLPRALWPEIVQEIRALAVNAR